MCLVTSVALQRSCAARATVTPGTQHAAFAFKKVTFVARKEGKGGCEVLDVLVFNTVTAQDNEKQEKAA